MVDHALMPGAGAYYLDGSRDHCVVLVHGYTATVSYTHLSYPKRIGMVFWSGHNMRTLGLDVAEFLALIGVKPVWSVNGRVSGVEVIAPEELKRPRIDVTVRMSGMYRDSLWPTVELMDDAIQAVIQLAEDDSCLLYTSRCV